MDIHRERQEKQSLKQLKSIATVRSVGASTRIEGSKLTDEEVDVLLKNIDITKLEDRDSQEAVGYFEALDIIIDMAAAMGIELLTEEQYRELQKLGEFDAKTSSWVKTPSKIKKLGGAIFADFRYGHVFVYHKGVQSYYGARAFRGSLRI